MTIKTRSLHSRSFLHIKTLIKKYVLKYKKQIYAAFNGFQAFDCVETGITEKTFRARDGSMFYSVTKDTYLHTRFVLKKGKLLSIPVTVKCGVKQ